MILFQIAEEDTNINREEFKPVFSRSFVIRGSVATMETSGYCSSSCAIRMTALACLCRLKPAQPPPLNVCSSFNNAASPTDQSPSPLPSARSCNHGSAMTAQLRRPCYDGPAITALHRDPLPRPRTAVLLQRGLPPWAMVLAGRSLPHSPCSHGSCTVREPSSRRSLQLFTRRQLMMFLGLPANLPDKDCSGVLQTLSKRNPGARLPPVSPVAFLLI